MTDLKEFAKDELGKHNTKEDLYVSIHGKVYDVTKYREDHPGGVDSLVEVAGTDATEAFEDLGHTADAREKLATFIVGILEGYHEEAAERQKAQRHLKPTPPLQQLDDVDGGKASHTHPSTLLAFSATAFAGLVLARSWDKLHLDSATIVRDLLPTLLPLAGVAVTGSVVAAVVLSHYSKEIEASVPSLSQYSPIKLSPELPALKEASHAVLQPRNFIDLPITEIRQISPNTKYIVLKLPHPNDVLGLPIGQHIAIRAASPDQNAPYVVRSYTPVSNNRDRGELKLVIKMYPDGKLTGGFLDKVKVGQTLAVSGPRGQMRYRKGLASRIYMLCGGTGITPMYQIIRAVAEDSTDNTQLDILFANNSEEDLLLKEQLDGFAKSRSDQIRVHYVLSKPPETWTGHTGFIDNKMVTKIVGRAAEDKKALLCGPPGLVKAVTGYLTGLGFDKPQAVSKLGDQVFMF